MEANIHELAESMFLDSVRPWHVEIRFLDIDLVGICRRGISSVKFRNGVLTLLHYGQRYGEYKPNLGPSRV